MTTRVAALPPAQRVREVEAAPKPGLRGMSGRAAWLEPPQFPAATTGGPTACPRSAKEVG